LNVDGTVNIVDIDLMSSEWLSGGSTADIEPVSGDGVVNLRDFAVLAASWGQSIYGP
jgi:hypothetical protein